MQFHQTRVRRRPPLFGRRPALVAAVLLLALPVLPILALEAGEPGADAGRLLRYEITHDSIVTPKTPTTDYWVWLPCGGGVETLYDGQELGEPALWHDRRSLAADRPQFERQTRQNLSAPKPGMTTKQEAWFDQGTRLLRTRFTTWQPSVPRLSSNEEGMPWDTMLWHRDLGLWFIAFLPGLAQAGAVPDTICLDSWSHLILMDLREGPAETVDGQACRVFNLRGQGLLSMLLHTGKIWVAAEGEGRVVRMEQDIRLSWNLPGLQARLAESGTATEAEWAALRARLAGG
jgi:hypothetical protein